MQPALSTRANSVISVLTCWAALLLLHPGVASAQTPFQVLKQGTATAFRLDASARLVTSQDELMSAWSDLRRRDQPPMVDFKRHSAVIYHPGLKPTTGYSIDIERVSIRAGIMQVEAVLTVPGAGCVTGQTATLPFVVIETVPWKGEVEAMLRRLSHDCN